MQRVLIVDDIVENRYLLEVLLKGNGFQICSAANGAEALALLRETPFDLIVSDILMPVMDGYTLCRECKGDERLRRIPFMFYTATYTDKKDRELALSLGAERFVIKPQEPGALMAAIRQTLDDSRDAGMPAAEEAPGDERLLREYNEVLFHKLEKKMADLEEANRELQRKIIEQKRTEEQLRQAQKMEAIGRFSAGIAHDFNNILTVIIGFGVMMNMQMAEDDPHREKVEHILAAAERAKNLTRSLLTFSRKQDLKLEPLDLNTCIRNTESFLRRVIGEDIRLNLSLSERELGVVADYGHLEQVLMNLATNARDAMPEGGVLSIGSDLMEMDGEFVSMHGYGEPGRYAVITVADSGAGMDETTRQRLFEPFYTTKESGQGTGLGLSIIYRIVQQHRGYISVYSEPGQGATFKIYLPLMGGGERIGATADSRQPVPGGDETILVVDDETAIREYLELFLTRLGYRVVTARDGEEGVRLFAAKREDIDLVLMDVILPLKSGGEAAREMRGMRGDIKILFTSGYPHDLILRRNLLEEGALLLVKPLNPSDVARALRDALNLREGA